MTATSPCEREFRDAMGRFATGLTVVTGMDGDEPVGFTCQSFVSVSLDPPLVSVCVMGTSRSWLRLRRSVGLCVHVLSDRQADLARRLAAPEGDRWAGVTWKLANNGAPLIEDTLLTVECSPVSELPAGDHILVLCRVTLLRVPDSAADDAPLLFYRGRFHQLAAA